jgi:RimJ/RimL family protein N-acetyltransferase
MLHGRAWWQGRQTGGVPLAPPTLTDGVITVRPLRDGDVPAIVAACQDPEIPRWTSVPSPYLPEDARRFLAIVASQAAAGSGFSLAMADVDDRLIGTVGLMEVHDGRGEIGYWVAAEARGRGAAVRATVLLRDWAHSELGLHTIEVLPHRHNHASRRVAERAGFTATGELRRLARMPPGQRDGYLVYRRSAGHPDGV